MSLTREALMISPKVNTSITIMEYNFFLNLLLERGRKIKIQKCALKYMTKVCLQNVYDIGLKYHKKAQILLAFI